MNKLTILCGISNSGKSTYAHNVWREDPLNTVIVNRDKIRELLFGFTESSVKEYYHRKDLHKLEEIVTEWQNSIIHDTLIIGSSVVVDATHLKPKYIKGFAEFADDYYCDQVEIVFFNITLKEALTRNKSRNRQVNEEVIIAQHEAYLNLRKNLTQTDLGFTYICKEMGQEDEYIAI